jgi:hypothetical protein
MNEKKGTKNYTCGRTNIFEEWLNENCVLLR